MYLGYSLHISRCSYHFILFIHCYLSDVLLLQLIPESRGSFNASLERSLLLRTFLPQSESEPRAPASSSQYFGRDHWRYASKSHWLGLRVELLYYSLHFGINFQIGSCLVEVAQVFCISESSWDQ